MFKKLIIITSLLFIGCSSVDDGAKEYAQEVIKNRKEYAVEIRQATVECLKHANNAKHLSNTNNNSSEVVKVCLKESQKLYNAHSEWSESFLYSKARGN